MGATNNPARKNATIAIVASRSEKRAASAAQPNFVLNKVAAVPECTLVKADAENSSIALLQRRCAYLEEQEKRHAGEVAELRLALSEAMHVPERVRADVVGATVELEDGVFQRIQKEESAPTLTVWFAAETSAAAPPPQHRRLDAGESVELQYPMVKLLAGRPDEARQQVWMRRRTVDPGIGQVAHSWVLLFETDEADAEGSDDGVLVSNFR